MINGLSKPYKKNNFRFVISETKDQISKYEKMKQMQKKNY